MNTLEKLKTITTHLQHDEMIAMDDQGNKHTLEEASKSGIHVTLRSSKSSALEDFKESFGIDLTDNKELKALQNLVEMVATGTTPSAPKKRKKFDNEEKQAMVKEWYENQEMYANKSDYCKKNNIPYQSFLNWEKQFG